MGDENIATILHTMDEGLRVLRLTTSGEPEHPEVGSTRERYALRRRNTPQNKRNLTAGLDFGGFIEDRVCALVRC
jgi:hypothetical protein